MSVLLPLFFEFLPHMHGWFRFNIAVVTNGEDEVIMATAITMCKATLYLPSKVRRDYDASGGSTICPDLSNPLILPSAFIFGISSFPPPACEVIQIPAKSLEHHDRTHRARTSTTRLKMAANGHAEDYDELLDFAYSLAEQVTWDSATLRTQILN